MCLLHNSILRGYNSIYQQAAHVRDEDKADFVGYAQTWYKFVKSHHDDEEAVLFTKVEELLDDKTIWAETHKEHGSSPPPVSSLLVDKLPLSLSLPSPKLSSSSFFSCSSPPELSISCPPKRMINHRTDTPPQKPSSRA